MITLKLVVQQLNERTEQAVKTERERLERDHQAAAEHERQVREAAARLRFDND